jgi:hypothetical protein
MKEYLGDGVYCDFDGYHFILTTENGEHISNIIYLEANVLKALKRYTSDVYSMLNKEEANSTGNG